MDTSRSFMTGAGYANNCGGRAEDLRGRERLGHGRPQMHHQAPPQQQQQQHQRCPEEPMLTNLETWKVVTGEPVEMETNNNVGPGEEAHCLVNTTSSVAAVSDG